MKPTDEWAAVLARMERWQAYAWQPPGQGRCSYDKVTTWRVTADIVLKSSSDDNARVELTPGTILRVDGRTWHDAYWNGPVSWTTTTFLVIEGRCAGAKVEHSTFFWGSDDALDVHNAFPPNGLEPVES